MLVQLRPGLYINPHNLIFMRCQLDSVVFRLFNGRAHKIDTSSPEIYYDDVLPTISRRIDVIEATARCHVNIDAIASVVLTSEGVAINVVQEALTIHRNEVTRNDREAAYAKILADIRELTAPSE